MASPLVVLPLALGTHPLDAVLFDGYDRGEVLGLDAATVARGVALSAGYLAYNLHVWLVPLGVGAVRLWRGRPAVAHALALVAGTTWLFAARYAVTDSYVFYLSAYVALVPCAAVGFDVLLSRAPERVRRAVVASLVAGPVLYAATVEVAHATASGRRIEATWGYKGGLRYFLYPGMRSVPDPLEAARTSDAPPGAPNPGWNLRGARRLLELEEEAP